MVSVKEKKQENKGVSTVRTERQARFTDTESTSTQCGRSLKKIKKEVKTVIELMGPSTPQFDNSSLSFLADNEESLYSNSVLNRQYQNKIKSEEYSTSTDCPCTEKTFPPDVTFDEDTNLSEIANKNTNSGDPRLTTPRLICPPPLLPANVVFNPECMCPQFSDYLIPNNPPPASNYMELEKNKKNMEKSIRPKNVMFNLLKSFKAKGLGGPPRIGEYYKINIKQSSNNQGIPERLIFDLVDDVPKDCSCYLPDEYMNKNNKNFNNEFPTKQELDRNHNLASSDKEDILDIDENPKIQQETSHIDNPGTTRVDVYYFDHGNCNYLRTTDSPPIVATELLAEKTERYTTRFWAEIFGSVHIGVSFCTSFLLQFIRFLLYSILRPLTIGLVQLLSDYFFKPFLATLFNAVIQPPLILIFNIATSLRDLCDPLAEGIGYFLRELAFLIRACRLVEVRKDRCGSMSSGACKTEERKARV